MKNMDRRKFLKVAGAATATVALASCTGNSDKDFSNLDPKGQHTGEVPTDKMTYRTNPFTGDKVSLLGYGMMRLPNKPILNENGDRIGEEIDQEQVNRLVKYSLDH
jgi:hypothetical protein